MTQDAPLLAIPAAGAPPQGLASESVPLPPLELSAHAREELGFADVEAIWQRSCATAMGREVLAEEPFPSTMAALEARMQEVLEASALIEARCAIDFGGVRDVRDHIKGIEKDALLGPFELLDFARTFEAIARIQDVLAGRREEAPSLYRHADSLGDERPFARRVHRSIDEQGQLTDEASPTLAELRARFRALRLDAQERLEDLVRDFDDAGVLRERNFTVRNDRYVLPVKAELQGRVEGIVHDASQTGQTVFVEPRALMELGNRIKIARAAATEEENRILAELTEEVRLRSAQLGDDLVGVGRLDAAFARGLFAARTDSRRPAVLPPFATKGALHLVEARHPLLAWMHASARLRGDAAVDIIPNDIGFGDRRALVITGPNAGGKTVALKTAGLAVLLVRAGMPIPADASSRVPIVSGVLSTIGDAQSLDDALSSFSGHLVGLRQILASARRMSERGSVLCLLDELASGTDPAQGAALAQAVLEELVDAGAFVVATTHYERLKLLALQETSGSNPFRNASVALDPDTHRPTFRLRLDLVGTSNALDAARRYGMPDAVVARAESLLDRAERDIQSLLSSLLAQQSALEERMAQLSAERARLASQREQLQRKLDDVEREAARLRRDGAKAFHHELEGARRVIASAIERAKKGADARELNTLSHQLVEEQRRAEELARAPTSASVLEADEAIGPGDLVEVVSMPGTKLEVLEVHAHEVVLARGAMKLRVERHTVRRPRAERTKGARGGPGARAPAAAASPAVEMRMAETTLDVRGERGAEAVELMEAFLDRLTREGRALAWILHGHGTGALKRAIRDALARSPYVARFAAADADDGGDACTRVELGDPSGSA